MQWSNLKKVQCPRCASKLTDTKAFGYKCTDEHCGYYISYEKFREVIDNLYKQRVYQEKTEERNAKWLNEL